MTAQRAASQAKTLSLLKGFSTMHLEKSKLLRYFATVFFTAGTIASIGFLGCTGVFLICTSIPLAVSVFLLSGAIEETVYGKSIYKGLGRLKLIGPKAVQHFLKLELDNYLENYLKKEGLEKLQQSENDFLKDYYAQQKYYKNLKKNHSNSADENELKEAKKRLADLRRFFSTKIMQGNLDKVAGDYISSELTHQSKLMLRRAKRRVWILTGLFVISVIVGLGAGFVTASSMSAALPALGIVLSAGALSAVIWPVAILAVIGAVFLLYKNMTDFFKENTLDKIKELCRNIIQSRAKSFVGLIIVSLTLFAAVATACTWWTAVNSGLALIPGVPLILVAVACPILIALNFATDLSFGASTTAKTIRALLAIRISELTLRLKTKFGALREKESLGQLINPFRIIIKLINIPFKVFIFSGHVVSMGITTDRMGGLPPILVAIGCSIPEALQDASFFVEEDHALDSHDHDHGGIVMSTLVWAKNVVLVASLMPIFSGAWHWLFRKEGSDVTFWNSIYNAVKQTCDIHEHKHEETSTEPAPTLSKAWREEYRPELILSEATERLRSAKIDPKLAEKKQTCLNNLLSEQEKVVRYLTQGAGKDKSTADAIDQYLTEKPEKERQAAKHGHLSNGYVSNGSLANGHANNGTMKNGYIKSAAANESGSVEKECPSYNDILSRRRTWSSNCGFFRKASAPTMTSQKVREAFSLVVPAAG